MLAKHKFKFLRRNKNWKRVKFFVNVFYPDFVNTSKILQIVDCNLIWLRLKQQFIIEVTKYVKKSNLFEKNK